MLVNYWGKIIYIKKTQVQHHQPYSPLGFDLYHNCNNDADVICMATAHKYRSISILDQILSSYPLSDTHYTQPSAFALRTTVAACNSLSYLPFANSNFLST